MVRLELVRPCGSRDWARLAIRAIIAIALLIPAVPGTAVAQAPPPGAGQPGDQDQQPDPPARVGRLSYISGTVSFRTLDADQWDGAVINYPITAGLGFWTEPDSRATLQLGSGAVRMDAATEVDIQQFDDQAIQIGVPQGRINFRLRTIAAGETYEIVTSTGIVRLNTPGRYDIAVTSDGSPAQVTVIEGSADIVGENGTVTVNGAQVGRVEPAPPPPVPGPPQLAPIDRFSDEQEAALVRVPDYVSPDMPGINDVVAVGAWESSPEYGRIWYPPVQVGWAPYRYGHWAFVPPWGWTWIDDAPWGFAPFHYGRWIQVGPRWAWIPGTVVERPVYAPALVAFIGGPSLVVGVSAGPVVGWIPLGPREVYVPPYGGSVEYVRHVNVTNVTNVTVINTTTINEYRTYNTDRFANARSVTVVRSDAMTNSAPIRNSTVQVDPARLRGATVAPTAPVQPTLNTKGVSPNIVQAAGGTVSGSETKKTAPGPTTGTKVFTPAPAGSKPAPGAQKTFVAPGGTKAFTPSGGGTKAGPSGSKTVAPPSGPTTPTPTPPPSGGSAPSGAKTPTPPPSGAGAPSGAKTPTPPPGPAGGAKTVTPPPGGAPAPSGATPPTPPPSGGGAPTGTKGPTPPPSGTGGTPTVTPPPSGAGAPSGTKGPTPPPTGGSPPAGAKTLPPPSGPGSPKTVTPPPSGTSAPSGTTAPTPPPSGGTPPAGAKTLPPPSGTGAPSGTTAPTPPPSGGSPPAGSKTLPPPSGPGSPKTVTPPPSGTGAPSGTKAPTPPPSAGTPPVGAKTLPPPSGPGGPKTVTSPPSGGAAPSGTKTPPPSGSGGKGGGPGGASTPPPSGAGTPPPPTKSAPPPTKGAPQPACNPPHRMENGRCV